MTRTRWVLVLAALVVAAGVVLLVALTRPGAGGMPTATVADDADATVQSAAATAEVREAAEAAATAAYSYSWETLADDKATARALMTTDMRRRYDRTMAGTGTASAEQHTVVSAEVLDTALVTATPAWARVLVFVNQSTTGDDLDEPQLDLDRVLMTLERVGGEWKVSELDAL